MVLLFTYILQPSQQTMKIRSQAYQQNVNKPGKVPKSLIKKEESMQVGPILLGVFLFVVVGSAIFQILNVASSGNEI
ncbi:Stress-associated endoplasmic reticulum protein 1 [Paramecium bursaria]